jgi:D-lyxose ketol-isomerase
MKRSEINEIVKESVAAINRVTAAPRWSLWTPEEWEQVLAITDEFFVGKWGNNVTDFGSGDFAQCGLFFITCINGPADGPTPYCRKLMVLRKGQRCPYHRHREKTKHIGVIAGSMALAVNDGGDREISISVSGLRRSMVPCVGEMFFDGDYVRLLPGMYHRFKGGFSREVNILEETSTPNDDDTDTFLKADMPPVSPIEEDVAAKVVLGSDLRFFAKNDYWPWQEV